MRAVVLYPGEDGYWIAECPSLPGCVSQGTTKPEALANVKEAIEGWLETAEAHGQTGRNLTGRHLPALVEP